ncbi:hypothetical protein BJP36_35885 [Moorena producens JHB]|uniref:Uncharacterized protein n=1 Tax=Moorena producens (strain JHB) TaxID=1454205 RepID=A0A9Q9STQ7_MOOP1|nr:hypothetical protein [Moorena producens]WAN69475.1 hypothetical protein BJP36_35885 [Moorena producens JHB]
MTVNRQQLSSRVEQRLQSQSQQYINLGYSQPWPLATLREQLLTFNLKPSTFNLQLLTFNLKPWPLATLREQL